MLKNIVLNTTHTHTHTQRNHTIVGCGTNFMNISRDETHINKILAHSKWPGMKIETDSETSKLSQNIISTTGCVCILIILYFDYISGIP